MKIEDYNKLIKELDESVGENWSTPRAKMYIAARLIEVDMIKQELAFERKVNDRVNEVFKGWFHRVE